MDKVKQWSLMISAVCIFSGVLLSLLPNSKLKPAYKTLTGILLIYVFLYPLIDSKTLYINIDDYIRDNYQVSENIDKYALSSMIHSAETAIEKFLEESLYKSGIICDVSVKCNSSNDEIVIERIEISGITAAESKQQIIAIALELGFKTDLICFSGE